jgi:glutamate dehydrogenase
VPLESLDPALRALVQEGPALIMQQDQRRVAPCTARAHGLHRGQEARRGRATWCGEHRFIGLFTSRAYGEDAESIPILRGKIRQILEETAGVPGIARLQGDQHDLQSMPKEELFLASTEEIGADVHARVLTSYHTEEVRVSLREGRAAPRRLGHGDHAARALLRRGAEADRADADRARSGASC